MRYLTEILAADAAFGGLADDEQADGGAAQRPRQSHVNLLPRSTIATDTLLDLIALSILFKL